jgi:hypothetical protein
MAHVVVTSGEAKFKVAVTVGGLDWELRPTPSLQDMQHLNRGTSLTRPLAYAVLHGVLVRVSDVHFAFIASAVILDVWKLLEQE